MLFSEKMATTPLGFGSINLYITSEEVRATKHNPARVSLRAGRFFRRPRDECFKWVRPVLLISYPLSIESVTSALMVDEDTRLKMVKVTVKVSLVFFGQNIN
jgi:hypothetical protein